MSTTLASPELAITTVRTLAIDGVQAANSGHPGAPMGLAPVGWTLFSRHLKHAPADPGWPDRDRFVLSAGHASMLLYPLLHLTGYDLPMEQLKSFRQLHSETPGHPERGDTAGVEITTGPLGQGFANAVGFALAEAMLAARYNRPGHEVVDHRTWFICSDGDLMEGISHEAASIAGFLGLEKLIGIWDDNHISLDGPTTLSFGEDVPARFAAYGWRVIRVEDGNDARGHRRGDGRGERPRRAADPDRLPHAHRLRLAQQAGHLERPRLAPRARGGRGHQARLRVARGRPLPRAGRGRPVGAGAGRARPRRRRPSGRRASPPTPRTFPAEAAELARVGEGRLPEGWESAAPQFAAGESIATRASAGKALNAFAVADARADPGRSGPLLVDQHRPQGPRHGRPAATSRGATSTTASASTPWGRSPTASRPTPACVRSARPSSRSRTT